MFSSKSYLYCKIVLSSAHVMFYFFNYFV
uniref:Uncharacterized protein n=1 Tax=Arundo donax TaxID=35708 RepID=A0A0A9BKE3_ARUDO